MVTAILLASGFSRRFQKDKLMLDFHGQPVLSHMMETISNCPFHKRLLITQSQVHADLAMAHGFIPYINTQAFLGQSASIKLGVSNASIDSAYMFFVGDQPCLTMHIINQLLAEYEQYNHSIIVPTMDGNLQNPVIFPPTFREELLSLAGDTGGKKIFASHPQSIRKIPFTDALPFTDMDTLDEYQHLLQQSEQENT